MTGALRDPIAPSARGISFQGASHQLSDALGTRFSERGAVPASARRVADVSPVARGPASRWRVGLDAGAVLFLEQVEEPVFVEVEQAPAVEFLFEQYRLLTVAAGFLKQLLDPLQ
jgi:hypothetical protein